MRCQAAQRPVETQARLRKERDILRYLKSGRSPDLEVLLLDGECRQTLACMRAYARASLSVGVVACERQAMWAPSFQSRWCSMSAALPDFNQHSDVYVDAVLSLLDIHPAPFVLPAHDGSIEALRARRTDIERRTTLGLASEAALDIAVSKSRTLALAQDLGMAIPRGMLVQNMADVPAVLSETGFPAVIKPDQSWATRNRTGIRLASSVVLSADDTKRQLDDVFSAGGKALIQQWLPGRREAVSLFYAGEQFWGRLAQFSHREWPVLGGVSVLCETIPLLPDITEPSERLVRAMDLEGCSMVEFRRDAEGRPVLMEVNPRMGGSVALAIAAGVDFPQLIRNWKLGRTLTRQDTYRIGQRLRWLAGDVWNLKCVFEDQGHPDVPPRGQAVARFLADFIRPGSATASMHIGDMRPELAEMRQFVLSHARSRVQRWPPVRWLTEVAVGGNV